MRLLFIAAPLLSFVTVIILDLIRPEQETTMEWTTDDDIAASREGWGVFDCFGSKAGPLQIQAIDMPGEGDGFLPDDNAAWDLVHRKASEGSELHRKALALIAEHNPIEAKAIEEWVARPVSQR